MTTNSPNKINLLVVDDHNIVRSGLAALINSEMDMSVVAQATNGQQAIDLFKQHRPDVALMDLRMPVVSGVEAVEKIAEKL